MTTEQIATKVVEEHAQATKRDWGANDHRLYEIVLRALRAAPTPAPTPSAGLFGRLCEAFWDLGTAPDCWCDTGDGNPHTQACMAAQMVTNDAKRAYDSAHNRALSSPVGETPDPDAQWECACGLLNRGAACIRCRRERAFTYQAVEPPATERQ